MDKTFKVKLKNILPSQLYINEEKLDIINRSFNPNDYKPFPIKKIGNNIFFTDGHTRAYSLFSKNIDEIDCQWDEDELSWTAYLVCLSWCREKNIKWIGDLKDFIVSKDQYKILWHDKCSELHEKLKKEPLSPLNIEETHKTKDKCSICEDILRSLPEWFGIEEAILEYIEGVKDGSFYSAFIADYPIGFFSIKHHFKSTSEIYVCGIYREFHNMGIGKALLWFTEQKLKAEQKQFLTVKTLSASHSDKNYQRTRLFYESAGFMPIEEFPTLWGEENPCLLLAKIL